MRLAALGCHVPEKRVDAEEIITSAGGRGIDARVFTKLFGIERVAVSDSRVPLEERFAPALRHLAQNAEDAPADALIYVHGLPIQYAAGRSPIVKLCRSHHLLASVRLVYEVDQNNCAGLFWALQMARNLLHTDVAQRVAIVAGDSLAELPLSHRYVPGCTLIGDAFSALLIDRGTDGPQIGELMLSHRAEFAFSLNGSEGEMRRFFMAHDGMVTDALSAVGYSWDGDEKLLPHNVNRLVWMQFCRRRQIEHDRIQLNLIPNIGHCYTTDPVLLLERLLADGGPTADAVTLLSVGLGAYIGACRVNFPERGASCV
jgi:3-oxoacyl-[acyl-carrier-protein] synthase-3